MDEIEQHQGTEALPQRIEATARFFSSIALAGHNEALRLMAQTMTAVLRERMTHVIPAHPRPDVFPLRRKVVQCLRARDAEGAVGALDELITALRKVGGGGPPSSQKGVQHLQPQADAAEGRPRWSRDSHICHAESESHRLDDSCREGIAGAWHRQALSRRLRSKVPGCAFMVFMVCDQVTEEVKRLFRSVCCAPCWLGDNRPGAIQCDVAAPVG